MSTVDTAPPSAPLDLKDTENAFFMQRDQTSMPSVVSVPGNSSFNLALFNVTATGSVKPMLPGTLILTLYGAPKPAGQGVNWLPLAASDPEPIGGAGELPETMWMIAGEDLMIFAGSGKMQGTFKTNIANHPIAAVDLQQHPGDIEDTDPLYVFALGASFTPTGAKGARDAAEEGVLCSLALASFTVNA